MYPACYRYWVEYELPNGAWTSLDFKAGWPTIAEARQRVVDQKAKGEPFASRRFRIVDWERKLVEPLAS